MSAAGVWWCGVAGGGAGLVRPSVPTHGHNEKSKMASRRSQIAGDRQASAPKLVKNIKLTRVVLVFRLLVL